MFDAWLNLSLAMYSNSGRFNVAAPVQHSVGGSKLEEVFYTDTWLNLSLAMYSNSGRFNVAAPVQHSAGGSKLEKNVLQCLIPGYISV